MAGENGKSNGKSNGLANGSGGHTEEEEAAPRELGPAPPQVAELVAACLRFVTSKYGVPLDGTSETLSLLDQYVRDARGEILVRPESIELIQATIGAYLGEVMRQAFGGEWIADGDHSTWRLFMTDVFLSFNPIGMMHEALTGEESEGWGAHLEMDEEDREAVQERLAALGEVDEAQYFLPSSRYDVVELTVQALRASARARGLSDVKFSREDYE
jgi:hypothetical protein